MSEEEEKRREEEVKRKEEEVKRIKVGEIADDFKAGDDALNKLKIQNLDFILDIPLKVTVELGRATVLIKDILQLGQGSFRIQKPHQIGKEAVSTNDCSTQ